MNQWMNVFLLVAKTTSMALFNPFFWLVIVIVFTQYRRAIFMEKKLFGRAFNNLWQQVVYSVGYGLLGGIFGGFFFCC
ncbi:MAG: hypothetical protein GX989_07890 [Firmicutes bacterium]|nr:hypothetical protein [Bacillota bacterium]